jgi:Family of unknown function (DUF6221)
VSTDAAVAWLREEAIGARLEAAKSAAGDGGSAWHADTERCCVRNEAGDYVAEKGDVYSIFLVPHIALNDPRQVIADCEADLNVLSLWQDPAEVGNLPEGVHDGRDPDERERDIALAEAVDDIVSMIAGRYRHWPGYGQHWGASA